MSSATASNQRNKPAFAGDTPTRLKVLVVHNEYQFPGGEDEVVRQEKNLLLAAGHTVIEYRRRNDEIADYALLAKAILPMRTIWARDSCWELRRSLQEHRPDLVHFHNTFPLISPAAYYVCREAGIPVVQTLHNYRLFCPAGTFFRDGRPCEECTEHSLWRGVRYRCYRRSWAATATTASMLVFHRLRQTWTTQVDCYIALTEFARRKFIEAGLPGNKILVKPNFVHPDPGTRDRAGDYAVFVGRLSPEKGLRALLFGWERLRNRIPLRIVGDGPLRESLEAEKSQRGLSSLSFEGWASHEEVLEVVKGARFLVFPSECYETFSMAIAEAFACAVPVIAPRLGAMAELVEDDRTGLHFTPGDPEDLAARAAWAWTHPEEMQAMGREARAEYEAKYTAERNYQMLMDIYQRARRAHR